MAAGGPARLLRGRWWLGGVVWAGIALVILERVPVSGIADRLPDTIVDGGGSTLRGAALSKDDPEVQEVARFLLEEALAAADLPGSLGYPPFVPARVLSVESGSRGGIRIDAGADDGVRPGDVVVRGAVLVGRVVRTDRFGAEVFPSPHPRIRLRARIPPAIADLRGGIRPFAVAGSLPYPGCLEIHIFSDWDRIREGDPVETLASEDRGEESAPGGLLVGTAVPVSDRSGTMIRGALVEPAVNPERLLAVVVLASGEPVAPGRAVAAGADAFAAYRRALVDGAREPVDSTRAWTKVPAFVLRGSDLFPHRRSATVDRGRRDGVCTGAAVVQAGRYLGRVARVDRQTSRFRLVEDPAARVAPLRLERPEGVLEVTSGSLAGIPSGLLLPATGEGTSEALESAREGSVAQGDAVRRVEIWIPSDPGGGP